jgi:nickel-dependent lactate racemase
VQFTLPDLDRIGCRCLGRIEAGRGETALPPDAVGEAMRSPLWKKETTRQTVFDTVAPGESVCVVVSDHTRKTAVDMILPPLVDGLVAKGCSADDMFILFASGIHRRPSRPEVADILGQDMLSLFKGRILFHDADDASSLVPVGQTSSGHEVTVNRHAVEADRLVLTGAVVYHYHAGFGGGRKSLVPGLAGRATIAHSHSLTLHPTEDRIHDGVEPGRLEGNPVAREILEGARLAPPDFIINTVLTPDGKPVGVFAGDMEPAHAAACRCAEGVFRHDLAELADLVVASAGTASNWIQSHKALYNASRAVHPHGRIVLYAPCPEGIGNDRFRYWVTRPDLQSIFDGLRKEPEILGQTALSTRIRGKQTILVTGMHKRDIHDLGIGTAVDVPSAITTAIADEAQYGVTRPTCYIMPEARYAVPFLGQSAKGVRAKKKE